MYILLSLFLLTQWQWNLLPGPYLGYISDIEVLDGDGTVLLASTWYGNFGGLYRSTDGGQNWQVSSTGIDPSVGNGLNAIASSPADRNIVLCGTAFAGQNYVYKSSDGGQTWVQTSYAGADVRGIAFFPGSADTVLLVGGGIYKSTNGGATWTLKQSITNGRAFCFKHNTADTIFVATQLGILLSVDHGETWVSTPFTKYSYDIVADPEAPDSLYVAGLVQGVFRVRDNGNTYDSLGLGGLYNTTIAFDSISRKIYIGGYAGNGRVRVSDDLGQTWYEYRSDQIYDCWINDVEVPFNNPNKIIAACYSAGVCIMTPSDSIWNLSSRGICQAVVRSIAVAPSTPATLYLGMSMVGVWRSTDGGATWSTDPQGLTWGKSHQTEYFPPGLAVSPEDPDIVFATFWGDAPDYYHAVLKTTDGGQTWQEKTNGLGIIPSGHRLNWIATHPQSDDTLFLATSYGAFKSTDEGESWVRKSSHHLYWIEVDPVEPNRLYATTACAAYYSSDGGETWIDRSNGLSNLSDVMMIDVDPQNNNIVYAALCGLETSDPLSGIYKSTDYGAQWVRQSSGLPGPPILRPRVLVDTFNSLIWATTPLLGTGIPGIYASNDEAASWYPEDTNLNTNRTMFLALGLGYAPLLGTQHSGVWAYQEVGISENSAERRNRYFRILSNPAHGKIRLQFNFEGINHLTMKIIDITGRIVHAIDEVTIYPDQHYTVYKPAIPSGIYFVQVQSGDIIATERLIYLR